MNLKKTATGVALLVFLLTAAGCNLPISGQPTPLSFPTPNLTQTALFKPPVIIPPTVTVPAVLTATGSGSEATQAPTTAPAVATATQSPTTAAPTQTVQATPANTSTPSSVRRVPV